MQFYTVITNAPGNTYRAEMKLSAGSERGVEQSPHAGAVGALGCPPAPAPPGSWHGMPEGESPHTSGVAQIGSGASLADPGASGPLSSRHRLFKGLPFVWCLYSAML